VERHGLDGRVVEVREERVICSVSLTVALFSGLNVHWFCFITSTIRISSQSMNYNFSVSF
jgi:hypothetical protein